MSLKKFLLIPLVLSLALFIHYSSAVDTSFHVLINNLHFTSHLIFIISIAIVLQLIGHIIRAYKAELLFCPVKENTTRFQFRALSIGYLFNTLLPIRLGELIRTRVISGAFDLSFSLTFSLIVIERAFDAAVLGAFGLVILIIIHAAHGILLSYVIGLLVLALLIFAAVTIAIEENVHLLKWFYHLSGIFRPTIRNSFRFKVWSVIYGLQRTLTPRQLWRYIGLSLLSWLIYASSVLVIADFLFPRFDVVHKFLLAVSPYYGLAIPAGPANLGVFSSITDHFTESLGLSAPSHLTFNLLSWVVLIIPIAVIGVGLLFVKTRESVWRTVPKQASGFSLENKLYRTEDISQEMSGFLENYFSGNSLSRIVHQLELKDNFRLKKYFKGGSDAITILAIQNGQEIVKKIIPSEFEDRLKAQYDWLQHRRNMDGIVNVIREDTHKDYYSIDLEYRPSDIMFFDFMHQNPFVSSTKVLDDTWRYLFKQVYDEPQKLRSHPAERQKYIDTHIFGCLEKAAKVDTELVRAAEPAQLNINGHQYDNLYQVMEKIKKHPLAWKDIASYKQTSYVHGDVAIDNILVSNETGRPLLIDPAPDGNIITGPVFDFGKNMQSLYCGYEFLLRDEEPVLLQNGDTINYQQHSSAQFTELCEYVRSTIAPKYLSKAEQRAMLFHAGALFIRRLKHQVYYNPANTLKFYAVGVKTFNDFLRQYDEL